MKVRKILSTGNGSKGVINYCRQDNVQDNYVRHDYVRHDRNDEENNQPDSQLTKAGFILAGMLLLAVLSVIGWGYGVVQNGAFSGLPKWRRA